MGQRIEIDSRRVVDDAMIVTTNRTLTGTDGEGYDSADEASEAESFGAKLATDLFESDDSISRVYVTSNVVIIAKGTGWSDASADAATGVISEFFLHY